MDINTDERAVNDPTVTDSPVIEENVNIETTNELGDDEFSSANMNPVDDSGIAGQMNLSLVNL